MASLGSAPKVALAIGLSACAAGAFELLLGTESQVIASAAALSDRVIVDSAGPRCSHRNWPYYEPECLRAANGRHPTRAVRIVSTDRLAP